MTRRGSLQINDGETLESKQHRASSGILVSPKISTRINKYHSFPKIFKNYFFQNPQDLGPNNNNLKSFVYNLNYRQWYMKSHS